MAAPISDLDATMGTLVSAVILGNAIPKTSYVHYRPKLEYVATII
jgi:hypothetical protein